jgi:hypothetical protein
MPTKTITKKKPWGVKFMEGSSARITLSKEQKAEGHFDGAYWIWGDKKKTLVTIIRQHMKAKRPLPPGFFIACEKSKTDNIVKMGIIAKDLGLKEIK